MAKGKHTKINANNANFRLGMGQDMFIGIMMKLKDGWRVVCPMYLSDLHAWLNNHDYEIVLPEK